MIPVYRKSKTGGAVVKFVARNEGYVIDPGTTSHKVGSFHTDWVPYYDDACWDPSYTYVEPGAAFPKTPDQLDLFETTTISSSAIITKVPNGYVMTSNSGHQLLIPSNSI